MVPVRALGSESYSVWKPRGRGPVVCQMSIALMMAALAIEKTYVLLNGLLVQISP